MDDKMNCEEVCELIGAYLDGELVPQEAQLIDKHIIGCADCERLREETADLKIRLSHVPHFDLPQGLSGRILERLDLEDGRSVEIEQWNGPWLRRISTHLGAMAAGLFIAIFSNQYLVNVRVMTDDIITSHIRHNLTRQFGTVISTDRHTVGPWFIGKVNYVPPVVDLLDKGFPLQNGWIDSLDGRPIAVLTYGRRKHKISLFVLPRDNSLLTYSSSKHRSGFNIAHWQSNHFRFVAISDLNLTDLTSFVAEHKSIFSKLGNKKPS